MTSLVFVAVACQVNVAATMLAAVAQQHFGLNVSTDDMTCFCGTGPALPRFHALCPFWGFGQTKLALAV